MWLLQTMILWITPFAAAAQGLCTTSLLQQMLDSWKQKLSATPVIQEKCVCVCVCVQTIILWCQWWLHVCTCIHQVHYYIDSLLSINSKMGTVNYSSLQPSLPTDKLPEGSECQLYGCTLSSDDTTYWMIEGERCNVSHPGVPGIVWRFPLNVTIVSKHRKGPAQ